MIAGLGAGPSSRWTCRFPTWRWRARTVPGLSLSAGAAPDRSPVPGASRPDRAASCAGPGTGREEPWLTPALERRKPAGRIMRGAIAGRIGNCAWEI